MIEDINADEWTERVFGTSRIHAGFSDRFNEMLDYCGFQTGRSRATCVMRFFNKKKSIVYYSLKNDSCPKDIVAMIDKLANEKRLPSNVDKKSLLIWLTTGVGSPFTESSDGFSVSPKHAEIIKRVINAVNREAHFLKISLSSCSDLDIATIYVSILKDMIDRESNKPSLRVIRKAIQDYK